MDLKVDPALCDVGGHFTAADADESEAEAPSADDILNSFGLSDAIIDEYDVAVDVSRLPDEGPWDGASGLETLSEARGRARTVAEGLADMALEEEVDVAVLVTHDAFLKLLLTELVAEEGAAVINCEVLNTATCAVEIDPLGGSGSAQLLWLNRVDHFLLAPRM